MIKLRLGMILMSTNIQKYLWHGRYVGAVIQEMLADWTAMVAQAEVRDWTDDFAARWAEDADALADEFTAEMGSDPAAAAWVNQFADQVIEMAPSMTHIMGSESTIRRLVQCVPDCCGMSE